MDASNELKGFPLIRPQVVAWGDMDAFAHVNNVTYFRYFETARIAYFENTGVADGGIPKGIGPILAHTECKFRAPLTYPDNLQLAARVVDGKESRFTMEYAVLSERLGRIAATGTGLVVAYDYGAGRKAEVPEHWREAITAYEAGVGNGPPWGG